MILHPYHEFDWELLVGHDLYEATEWAAEFSIKIRTHNPNDLITADYDQDRLNVETVQDAITKIIGFG